MKLKVFASFFSYNICNYNKSFAICVVITKIALKYFILFLKK